MLTSKQALNRLRDLSKEAGGNVYARTALAAQLLADKAWIAAEHGGDDWAALDMLEDQFFHDLAVPLTDLIRVYQNFPTEAQWAGEGFKVRKLLNKLKSPAPSGKTQVRRVTVKQYESLQTEKKHFEAANRTLDKNLTEAKTELESLRTRVATLERENTRLKGRIEELERIVEGRLGKKAS